MSINVHIIDSLLSLLEFCQPAALPCAFMIQFPLSLELVPGQYDYHYQIHTHSQTYKP